MRRYRRTNRFRIFLGVAVAISLPSFMIYSNADSFASDFDAAIANLLALAFFSSVFGAVIAFADGSSHPNSSGFDSNIRNGVTSLDSRSGSFDRDWNEINRTTASGFQDSHHVVSGQSLIRTGNDPY